MCSVMICDDLAEYRALVRAVLAPHGAVFTHDAADGLDCIERIQSEQPDCLLLDLHMPRMDGLEALPYLRAAAPDAKVIVLTTNPDERLRQEALRLGADAIVAKPRNILDLAEDLREALAA
jgi:CheY-like chemotaxis protein